MSKKHTNHTVYSFPKVAQLLNINIREVEKLVRYEKLEKVISEIFKCPAITRKSYEKYLKLKAKSTKEENEKSETLSRAEASRELGVVLNSLSGYACQGLILRQDGGYNKASVLAYKASRDKRKALAKSAY